MSNRLKFFCFLALSLTVGMVVFGPSEAADRNGWGVVYNKSDCGNPPDYYNVRRYSFGGDGPGSACGFWSLTENQRKAIWSNGDHNWSQEDIGSWIYNNIGKPAEEIAQLAKAHARQICRAALPAILKQATSADCKSTAAKFEEECNVELDLETEGAAAAAYAAGMTAILEECKATAKGISDLVKPVTKLACDAI